VLHYNFPEAVFMGISYSRGCASWQTVKEPLLSYLHSGLQIKKDKLFVWEETKLPHFYHVNGESDLSL
jgi:hypothetical protein